MTAVPESSVFPRDGSVGVDAVALRTGHRHAGRVRPRRADSLTRRRRDVGGNLRKRRIAIGSRPPGRGCGVRCRPGWPAPRASAVCGSAAARVGGRSGGWVPTIVPAQSSPPWGGCSFGGLGRVPCGHSPVRCCGPAACGVPAGGAVGPLGRGPFGPMGARGRRVFLGWIPERERGPRPGTQS